MAASTIDERLAALGLTMPNVVAPAGSYVPAVRSGAFVYTAGQVPMVDGRLPAVGRLGEGIDVAQGAALARIAALNALAAAHALVGLENVVRVVKVVGFVAATPEFTQHPAVINGASDLLGQFFGPAGAHARSAVGVASLPFGSPVEVEIVLEVRDPS